jgi:hypothetical protein
MTYPNRLLLMSEYLCCSAQSLVMRPIRVKCSNHTPHYWREQSKWIFWWWLLDWFTTHRNTGWWWVCLCFSKCHFLYWWQILFCKGIHLPLMFICLCPTSDLLPKAGIW